MRHAQVAAPLACRHLGSASSASTRTKLTAPGTTMSTLKFSGGEHKESHSDVSMMHYFGLVLETICASPTFTTLHGFTTCIGCLTPGRDECKGRIVALIISQICSNLAFGISHQFCCCANNCILACLFDLALEDDLVALAPHLRHNSLTGIDSSSEADLDILDRAIPRRISSTSHRESL